MAKPALPVALLATIALAPLAPQVLAAVPASPASLDPFAADTVALGVWEHAGSGTYAVEGGWLREKVGHGVAVFTVRRPVDLDPQGAVLEARVRAQTLYRYAVQFVTPSAGVNLEFDDWGFCLCRSTPAGFVVQGIAPPGQVGEEFVLRLGLGPGGNATAQVFDSTGALLGQAQATHLAFGPQEVTQVGLSVWTDLPWNPRSEYATDYVLLLPSALLNLGPLPGDGPA